jgi:hypothetical protein
LADHPNKHIRQALKYAESKGWIVKKAGPRAHAWGIIHCEHGHGGCRMSIWSTPRVPENHAKAIRRKVDRCPGPTN